jgi:uncharacterized protein (DUF111 family)
MHIHLDPVGGVAGDMFIAAALHAFPEMRDGMLAAIRAAGIPHDVEFDASPHIDTVLSGMRFTVSDAHALHSHDHHHAHVPFRDIRARLQASGLLPAVRDRAIAIFTLLAEVEARIHGASVETISFHELGGWDSIADMVGAAYLIETIGAPSWSVGSLPLGSGLVKTEHGMLPVPTPATAMLLEGFAFHDDGRPGERVTPTGAAILRHLNCAARGDAPLGKLKCAGYGFGTRKLTGMSNVRHAAGGGDRIRSGRSNAGRSRDGGDQDSRNHGRAGRRADSGVRQERPYDGARARARGGRCIGARPAGVFRANHHAWGALSDGASRHAEARGSGCARRWATGASQSRRARRSDNGEGGER